MTRVQNHHMSNSAPRYATLAETLMHNVNNGLYPIGSLLPTELELMRQYDVSRHTVREATRRLVEMGLVSRHAGIGTRVRKRHAETQYVAALTSLDDLIQFTKETWLEVLGEEHILAQGKLAQLLRCPPGHRWFMLRTLRYPIGEKKPISYTEIYLQPQYESLQRFLVKGKSVTIYSLLEQHYNEKIVEVRQDISAISIPKSKAQLLRERTSAPGLHVVRCYVGSKDRPLAISINTYPAKHILFSTRWQLKWADKSD